MMSAAARRVVQLVHITLINPLFRILLTAHIRFSRVDVFLKRVRREWRCSIEIHRANSRQRYDVISTVLHPKGKVFPISKYFEMSRYYILSVLSIVLLDILSISNSGHKKYMLYKSFKE